MSSCFSIAQRGFGVVARWDRTLAWKAGPDQVPGDLPGRNAGWQQQMPLPVDLRYLSISDSVPKGKTRRFAWLAKFGALEVLQL
jgi:hypothetical protein